MGTHPIFESDFDCLTDFFSTWDTKTSGSLTKEKTLKDVDSASAVSPAAARVLSVNTGSTFPAVLSVKSPLWSDSRNSTRPETDTRSDQPFLQIYYLPGNAINSELH